RPGLVRLQPRRHARPHDRRAVPLDAPPRPQPGPARPAVVPVLLRPEFLRARAADRPAGPGTPARRPGRALGRRQRPRVRGDLRRLPAWQGRQGLPPAADRGALSTRVRAMVRGGYVWAMTNTRADPPAALPAVWPCRAPTPLIELPRLATRCGVAKVVLKDEGLRPLGSFKALGGVYAGLRALARATGLPDIAALVAA